MYMGTMKSIAPATTSIRSFTGEKKSTAATKDAAKRLEIMTKLKAAVYSSELRSQSRNSTAILFFSLKEPLLPNEGNFERILLQNCTNFGISRLTSFVSDFSNSAKEAGI